METNTMEIFTIDAHDLDVEELEERLELAALLATNASSASGEQGTAADLWHDPSCLTDWHKGCG